MLDQLFKLLDDNFAEPCVMVQKQGKWFVVEALCCGAEIATGKSIILDTAICRVMTQIQRTYDYGCDNYAP